MRRALFPGSFNPFHAGHADVLRQGFRLFDEIIVAIERKANATSHASPHDVRETIMRLCSGVDNLAERLTVESTHEPLPNLMVQHRTLFVIRGFCRDKHELNDIDIEQDVACGLGISKPLNIVLIPDRSVRHLSSESIRQAARYRYLGYRDGAFVKLQKEVIWEIPHKDGCRGRRTATGTCEQEGCSYPR